VLSHLDSGYLGGPVASEVGTPGPGIMPDDQSAGSSQAVIPAPLPGTPAGDVHSAMHPAFPFLAVGAVAVLVYICIQAYQDHKAGR
jgi:hypothetical protein